MDGFARNGAPAKAALEGLLMGGAVKFFAPDARIAVSNVPLVPRAVTGLVHRVITGGSGDSGSDLSHSVASVLALNAFASSFIGDIVWGKVLGVPPGGQLATMPSFIMSFVGQTAWTGAVARYLGAGGGSSRLAILGGVTHLISESLWDAFPDADSTWMY